MKQVRRLIVALSAFIGIWVLASFTGAMIDSANASFWSSSLMWSLLSALIVMPALVMVNHASTSSSRQTAQKQPPEHEQEPFIQDGSDETRTLWPEPEQETQHPSERSSSEQRVRPQRKG